MSLARKLEELKRRGFSQEQAEVIALMREAATILFKTWPESFVLYGGANLIFFHESFRHSADLDLHVEGAVPLPNTEELISALTQGLEPLAKLLDQAPIEVKPFRSDQDLLKVGVLARSNRTLFTVDISRMGSVIQSGIDTEVLEALGVSQTATVKFVAGDHLLLQKAETFLVRKFVKARDAYDIKLLLDRGATLSGNLHDHLADFLLGEFDSEYILTRIASVNEALCPGELKPFLPEEIYVPLEAAHFQQLRDGLSNLFRDWL